MLTLIVIEEGSGTPSKATLVAILLTKEKQPATYDLGQRCQTGGAPQVIFLWPTFFWNKNENRKYYYEEKLLRDRCTSVDTIP